MASEPVRTCIGCRQRAARRELVRVTAGSDASGLPVVVPDPRKTTPGRGAHLHPTTSCYELAVRKKAFGRALRVAGRPDSAAVATYVETVEQSTIPHSSTLTEDRPEGWSSSS